MPALGKTKVWGKGYTTVPDAVRRMLELETGSEIEWVFVDGTMVVKKAAGETNGRD